MSRKTFPNLEIGDCFLGMENEVEQLVHYLGKDTEDRIISVWGMGGSSKTAIAKKLYNETTAFDLSAWVCITQQCESRSVWEDVLRQLENPKKQKKGVSVLNDALGECRNDLRSSKLVFLSLFGSEIEDDPMGILGKLPCLIRLRLYWKSFVGEEMRCPANSFP